MWSIIRASILSRLQQIAFSSTPKESESATVNTSGVLIRYADSGEFFTSTLFTAHTFQGDMVILRLGFGSVHCFSPLNTTSVYYYIKGTIRLISVFRPIPTNFSSIIITD
mgnify:FL=1